jgi:hypothetical protein
MYQVRVMTVFTVFRLLTDFVCLYNYEKQVIRMSVRQEEFEDTKQVIIMSDRQEEFEDTKQVIRMSDVKKNLKIPNR